MAGSIVPFCPGPPSNYARVLAAVEADAERARNDVASLHHDWMRALIVSTLLLAFAAVLGFSGFLSDAAPAQACLVKTSDGTCPPPERR